MQFTVPHIFFNQFQPSRIIFRITALFFFLFFLLPLQAQPQAIPDYLNLLKDVSSQSHGGELLFRLEFQNPIEFFDEPLFHKQSVQIDIPHTSMPLSSRIFLTGDSLIPQLLLSKTKSNKLRLRFLVDGQISLLKEKINLVKEGRSLIVRIDKSDTGSEEDTDVLDRFLARASKNLIAPKKMEESEEADLSSPSTFNPDRRISGNEDRFQSTAYSEKPEKRLVEPFNSISKKSTPETEPISISDPELSEPFEIMSSSMKMLTMLSVVLGFIFILFYLFKKLVLKNTPFGEGEKLVRVLSTGYLGPKKNIVLVEVAGDVLVLGISNENISLLGNIQDKEKIELIKNTGEKRNQKTLWSRQKSSEPRKKNLPKHTSVREFTDFLKQYTPPNSGKGQSAEEVMAQIRRNLEKLKTA